MAHQSQDIPAVQTALDNINAAWKTATECMLKENKVKSEAKPEGEAQGDDVQDVDYEEVK
jgi:molecular chaperone DnaK